jgi:hypothetical protein
MTALTEDPTTAQDALARAPWLAMPAAWGRERRAGAWLLAAACIGLAALTLLAPSSPTYDPWSWVIWGREVLHLDLVTTTGPSWKPLPVLFTTVFGLFGGAAPALWLVVARAGALAAIVLAYLVGRRLGAGRTGAGIAAVALATAPWWTVNAWLGNSEPLLVACLLGALFAHLQRRPRATFALAVAAGLLRPEAWPLIGLYGLWLVWRRRDTLALVAAGFLAVPALWLLPEQWGSGNPWRASTRARTDLLPGSPGRAAHPAVTILGDFWHLLPAGVWAAVATGAVLAVLAARRRETPWPALGLAALAVAWVALVAAMASHGYSGNSRYLIAPAAMVVVLAGVGAGGVLRALPARLRPVVAVGVGVAFALSGLLGSIDDVAETRAQSRLPRDLAAAVARAGGAQRLAACGPVYTEPLLVPQVAWRLGVHLDQVSPRVARGPAVVFRARVSPQLAPYPPLDAFAGLAQRTLAVAPRWRVLVVGRCAR